MLLSLGRSSRGLIFITENDFKFCAFAFLAFKFYPAIVLMDNMARQGKS
jgi:hypothetical protein